MKKILGVVMLVFLLVATPALAKIYIVPANMPGWAVNALNGEKFWFTRTHAYATDVAAPMGNRPLQRITAENRARARLLKGLGVTNAIVKGIEIRDVWEDPDTHKVYALVRIHINIIPAE